MKRYEFAVLSTFLLSSVMFFYMASLNRGVDASVSVKVPIAPESVKNLISFNGVEYESVEPQPEPLLMNSGSVRSYCVWGTVIDEDTGAPVADAKVAAFKWDDSLWEQGSKLRRPGAFHCVTTNADGQFTIDGCVPAQYGIKVWHDNYIQSEPVVHHEVYINEFSDHVELAVSTGAVLAGSATFLGTPVDDVTVKIEYNDGWDPGWFVRPNDAGLYLVEGLTGGEVTITASYGPEKLVIPALLNPDGITSLDLAFGERSASITGRIIPYYYAFDYALQVSAAGEDPIEAVIYDDGVYEIKGLAAKKYRMQLTAHRGEKLEYEIRSNIQTYPNRPRMCDLFYTKNSSPWGYIDNANWNEDVTVFASRGMESPHLGTSAHSLMERLGSNTKAIRQSDGTFAFDYLTPGVYTVTAVGDDERMAHGILRVQSPKWHDRDPEDPLETFVLTLDDSWTYYTP